MSHKFRQRLVHGFLQLMPAHCSKTFGSGLDRFGSAQSSAPGFTLCWAHGFLQTFGLLFRHRRTLMMLEQLILKHKVHLFQTC